MPKLYYGKSIFILLILIFLGGCSSLANKQRAQVVNTAVKEVGTPYQFGGKKHNIGFDCSGLVYYSYTNNGHKVPRNTQQLYKASSRVWFARKKGDLLFFNTDYRWWNVSSWGKVTHVGIYIGDGKMIHAPSTGGKVHIVNNVFENKYWINFYKNTRRII